MTLISVLLKAVAGSDNFPVPDKRRFFAIMLIIRQKNTYRNKISIGIGFCKGIYAFCAARNNHGCVRRDILRDIEVCKRTGADDSCFHKNTSKVCPTNRTLVL